MLEALDLVLGPDRLSRQSPIDEHDFYQGKYFVSDDWSGDTKAPSAEEPRIIITATITALSDEQLAYFGSYIEWWDASSNKLFDEPNAAKLDAAPTIPALRITFIGRYDQDEDDFEGKTYYTRTLVEADEPDQFGKRDKQRCGFLYLRSIRTGSRALSLEQGSLLDIILRLKEIRPKMWEATLSGLLTFDVASNPELGVSGVLGSIDAALKKYVPSEWGIQPHLRVSALTRRHLREVITAFIATGDGAHSAPYYRQGTGTVNMLLLAMLSQIAEDKQNVIFAMEELETAIPPYAQKRIVHELRNLAAQSLVTSHSPYVLEEFSLDETLVLRRSSARRTRECEDRPPRMSVKHKRYHQEFVRGFAKVYWHGGYSLLRAQRRPQRFRPLRRRLAELIRLLMFHWNRLVYRCSMQAQTVRSSIWLRSTRGSGRRRSAFATSSLPIRRRRSGAVERLFMHEENGFEDLILKNTTQAALERFANGSNGRRTSKRNTPTLRRIPLRP